MRVTTSRMPAYQSLGAHPTSFICIVLVLHHAGVPGVQVLSWDVANFDVTGGLDRQGNRTTSPLHVAYANFRRSDFRWPSLCRCPVDSGLDVSGHRSGCALTWAMLS